MKTQNLLLVLLFLLTIFVSCGDKCTNAPVISAGNDTIVFNSDFLTLHASTDADSGRWSILSGDQGKLENPTLPDSKFSGLLNNEYTLVWSSENGCGSCTDTLKVSFKSKYSVNQMVDSIDWTDQSSFRFKGAGITVYIDPQSIKAGSAMADVILITHSHSDHYSASEIKKIANENTRIYVPAYCNYTGVCKELISVAPGYTTTVSPNFSFKAVPAYNSNHPVGNKWVGYVLTLDGVTVYHAGDTGRLAEMKEIDCDIAMLPLGQTYTMKSVDEAAESAKDVKAEVAIPMHYGGPEGKVADATTFKTLLEGQIKVVIKTKK